MTILKFPDRAQMKILFAHAAYQLGEEFLRRGLGIAFEQVRTLDALRGKITEADVVVASGLWRNDMIGAAPRLRFIQSISAGVDNFDQTALAARGIRLASARGGNANAVAEHGIGLMLALARHIHKARDRQMLKQWRGMISDPAAREQELSGKTLAIIGLGGIGARLARLAKAFDMRVIGVRRDTSAAVAHVDALHAPGELPNVLAQADYVALTCPLTRETEGLVNAAALSAMKPTACLLNLARGRVVDEAALTAALGQGTIAAAGLDCFHDEPLPESSPLWAFENVIITPHSAGETENAEARIVDILCANLERLWRGGAQLVNQVV